MTGLAAIEPFALIFQRFTPSLYNIVSSGLRKRKGEDMCGMLLNFHPHPQ